MEKVTLWLETLGKIHLYINGEECHAGPRVEESHWQMFVLLVLHKEKYLKEAALASLLWEEETEEIAKEKLCLAGETLNEELFNLAGIRPVKFFDGGYHLFGNLGVGCDCLEVICLCEELQKNHAIQADELLPRCTRLLRLYGGGFLCGKSAALWMREATESISAQFMETAEFCSERMWHLEMYSDIVEFCARVKAIHPPSEALILYGQQAMEALGKGHTLQNRHGQTAPPVGAWNNRDDAVMKEIQIALSRASQCLQKEDRETKKIVHELMDVFLATKEKDKPAICSYNELKKLCRDKPSRYAMVAFTFHLREEQPESATMKQAIEAFQAVAEGMLRGHDLIIPHTENRVLVMLPNHSVGTAHQVKKRIYSSFENTEYGEKVFLQTEVAELRPSRGCL